MAMAPKTKQNNPPPQKNQQPRSILLLTACKEGVPTTGLAPPWGYPIPSAMDPPLLAPALKISATILPRNFLSSLTLNKGYLSHPEQSVPSLSCIASVQPFATPTFWVTPGHFQGAPPLLPPPCPNTQSRGLFCSPPPVSPQCLKTFFFFFSFLFFFFFLKLFYLPSGRARKKGSRETAGQGGTERALWKKREADTPLALIRREGRVLGSWRRSPGLWRRLGSECPLNFSSEALEAEPSGAIPSKRCLPPFPFLLILRTFFLSSNSSKDSWLSASG